MSSEDRRRELQRALNAAADSFAIAQMAFTKACARWRAEHADEYRAWLDMPMQDAPRLTSMPSWIALVSHYDAALSKARSNLDAACLAYYVGGPDYTDALVGGDG